MIRIAFALLSLALFGLWIYSIVDVIATPRERVRNLPKLMWALIIVLLGIFGAAAWFAWGRPRFSGASPGAPHRPAKRPPRRVLGPEDDPNWGK